jgi:threonine dehydratase
VTPLPEVIPLEAIRAARARIADAAIRTPLIRLPGSVAPEIWLKLETLQPVGSFKIRGARNAIAELDAAALSRGVYTASAGNMALGLAWCARARNLAFTSVVPEHAPRAKLSQLEALGARIVPVPFERWWRVLREHHYEGLEGRFVHPVADVTVMAGNGTIGLEILEDLPNVETVLVPFGGGGLSCGIASALAGMHSKASVVGCEIETATPLRTSLQAGGPRTVERTPSFVDGIGGAGILPEMWPLIERLIDADAVVSLAETAGAIRTLVERVHVVAEGAGAVPLAAALSGRVTGKVICCVISGGNLDTGVLADILTSHLSL